MSWPVLDFVARDSAGIADADATYFVYERGTTTEITCKPNPDGTGTTITQPISVDSSGRGYCFVNGSRRVDVLYSLGS